MDLEKLYSHFNGKKVLVTGAGGFIGSHLAEKLVEAGAEVTALAHYNALNSWGNLELVPKGKLGGMKVVLGDISDPFFVRQLVAGHDIVFHLAALIGIPYSYVAPQQYVAVNIQGTVNVLEACRGEGVQKLVQTSTSETYGTAIYTPIDEKHPLQGQSPYSASKIAADMMAESYYRSFGLPVATCRPFNTFGPRQSARAVIPTMILQLLEGGASVKLGSLEPYRDFNFVADTVDGFLAVAASESTVGEVVNIGSGRTVTIRQVWEQLLAITGASPTVDCEADRVRPEKSEVMKLQADAGKASRLTGWQSSRTLEEGLRSTVKWFSEYRGRYKAGTYTI